MTNHFWSPDREPADACEMTNGEVRDKTSMHLCASCYTLPLKRCQKSIHLSSFSVAPNSLSIQRDSVRAVPIIAISVRDVRNVQSETLRSLRDF